MNTQRPVEAQLHPLYLWHLLEATGQLDVRAALLQWEGCMRREAWWALEAVWTLWERKIFGFAADKTKSSFLFNLYPNH